MKPYFKGNETGKTEPHNTVHRSPITVLCSSMNLCASSLKQHFSEILNVLGNTYRNYINRQHNKYSAFNIRPLFLLHVSVAQTIIRQLDTAVRIVIEIPIWIPIGGKLRIIH